MATEVLCPICRQPSKPLKENKSFPFCTERCKMNDLGKWFDESYSVPDGPAPPPPNPDEF